MVQSMDHSEDEICPTRFFYWWYCGWGLTLTNHPNLALRLKKSCHPLGLHCLSQGKIYLLNIYYVMPDTEVYLCLFVNCPLLLFIFTKI